MNALNRCMPAGRCHGCRISKANGMTNDPCLENTVLGTKPE